MPNDLSVQTDTWILCFFLSDFLPLHPISLLGENAVSFYYYVWITTLDCNFKLSGKVNKNKQAKNKLQF